MHNEKFIDALYRFYDMLAEDFTAFVDEVEQNGLDTGAVHHADCEMHLAKNLLKVLYAEEGMSPEEIEGMTGGNQAYGRAIRTTPGFDDMSGINRGGNGQSGANRSMRGTSRNGGRSSYSMDGGSSGKRDAMGRFSGAKPQDVFSKLQTMADMTTNHDEREIMLRMIERAKNEMNQA